MPFLLVGAQGFEPRSDRLRVCDNNHYTIHPWSAFELRDANSTAIFVDLTCSIQVAKYVHWSGRRDLNPQHTGSKPAVSAVGLRPVGGLRKSCRWDVYLLLRDFNGSANQRSHLVLEEGLEPPIGRFSVCCVYRFHHPSIRRLLAFIRPLFGAA